MSKLNFEYATDAPIICPRFIRDFLQLHLDYLCFNAKHKDFTNVRILIIAPPLCFGLVDTNR